MGIDANKMYDRFIDSNLVDDATREDLYRIAGSADEIEDRFGKKLTFGTAGLRAEMGAGTNRMNVFTVRHATQALCRVLSDMDQEGESVAIAYDCRNNSAIFAKAAAGVLAGNGFGVYLFADIAPTPELSFTVRDLKCAAGINITASHNPKEYNGYKVYFADGGQITTEGAEAIMSYMDELDILDDVKFIPCHDGICDDKIKLIGEYIDERYIEEVLKLKGDGPCDRDISIVFTPFHGTGYSLIPEVLERAGFRNINVVPEQMMPDGNFPTLISPNPENFESFELAVQLATDIAANIIIGTDPDADRICVISRNGMGYVQLTGNQTGIILADYIITRLEQKGELPDNAVIIKTIVTTYMADAMCAARGVLCVNTLTGFKYIGDLIKRYEESGDHTFIFGFEESMGYLAASYARDKDAVSTALLIAEAAGYYRTKGMTLVDALYALYAKYGYYSEKVRNVVYEGYGAAEKMKNAMQLLRLSPPSHIGGLAVIKSRDLLVEPEYYEDVLIYELEKGAMVVVRPSGTEPKIKIYNFSTGGSNSEANDLLRQLVNDRFI